MLQIINLTKSYNKKTNAVDRLSLSIKPGEVFGFIGHNGAGKSTAIKCIVGALNFEDGEILIDGVSVKENPIYCKSITAYIPDNPDIYDYLTGIQYLNFVGDIYGVEASVRESLITDYATRFEIINDLGNLISTYSHGMKQKLVLLSALIHKPKLLVLDEPFVGLDPLAAHNVKQIMRELCDSGSSIFFSTHVLEVAEKLCDRVGIIKKGKLVAQGNMEEIVGDKSLESIFLEIAKEKVDE
ncbi:MAG: ABC transporter ATP-binding protein [Clostridia bacterium]|nr:ABC transporter ATP-binding protein [Clostridia bacterium]